MTEETLRKLKDAFLIGCTDQEACLYAEIAPSSLYAYQEEHPEYSEKKAAWKQKPFLRARQTIINDLKNVETSKWYLERKKRKEFSTRHEAEEKHITRIEVVNYGENNSTL